LAGDKMIGHGGPIPSTLLTGSRHALNQLTNQIELKERTNKEFTGIINFKFE
jgi:hypothetical protein